MQWWINLKKKTKITKQVSKPQRSLLWFENSKHNFCNMSFLNKFLVGFTFLLRITVIKVKERVYWRKRPRCDDDNLKGPRLNDGHKEKHSRDHCFNLNLWLNISFSVGLHRTIVQVLSKPLTYRHSLFCLSKIKPVEKSGKGFRAKTLNLRDLLRSSHLA